MKLDNNIRQRTSVLFLIPTLGGGGAEKVLVNLVNNMDYNRFDVTVQSLYKPSTNAQYLRKEVEFIEGRIKQFRGSTDVVRLLPKFMLYRMFVGKKYDIVVSYLEGSTARIISSCPYPNTKKAGWIHIEMTRQQTATDGFLTYNEAFRVYNGFDAVCCVAEKVKTDFMKIFPLEKEPLVLYNTNEEDKIKEKTKEAIDDCPLSDGVNLISVGRIIEQKGFNRLLAVHKRLLDNGIKHHVYIVGKGELYGSLVQQAEKLGVQETFHILGFHDNPYKFVSKADLFVCSSNREGFSTAVTEALIMGVPVVSTNVSGAKEMLGQNNEYGIVTDISEDALYNGVKKMLTEDGLLAYYKKQAEIRGKKFTKEKTASAVMEMLNNL